MAYPRSLKTRKIVAAIGALFSFAVSPVTSAATSNTVTAAYEGVVNQDSGLGYLGQTLRVDLAYRTDVTGLSGFPGATTFVDAVTRLDVSIAGHTVSMPTVAGSSEMFVADNLATPYVGTPYVSDYFGLRVFDLAGPSLVDAIASPRYTFEMLFWDETPEGHPDGISGLATPPVAAPDPANFSSISGPPPNVIWLSISDRNGVVQPYFISMSDITLISTVPEPGAASMLLVGLGVLSVFTKRKHSGKV